jgi:hypothetical protein
MKRWDYVDPAGHLEGFIQHRKRCTGRPRPAPVAAGPKSKKKTMDEEETNRVGDSTEDEVEVVEDEGAELQMLLDAVTEVYSPDE